MPVVRASAKPGSVKQLNWARLAHTKGIYPLAEQNLVLLWTTTDKRIITGSDLLGRLLRGIVKRESK